MSFEGEVDLEHAIDDMDDLQDTLIPCPVCHAKYDICDIFVHVFNNHPTFLLVWRSVYCPLMPNMMYDYEIEFDHIDHVAPLTHIYGDATSRFTCPICFEPPHNMMSHRKIKKCGHIFCSKCIESWFRINVTCPMCRVC